MSYPSPNIAGTDHIGVEGLNKINAHFNDASQHSGGSTSGMRTVSTVARLEALTGITKGETRWLAGYYAAGDAPGSPVRRVASSSATRDGAVVFASADGGRWIREWGAEFYAEWAGTKGDGATDDTAKIQAAVDALKTRGGGTLYFAAKTYRVTNVKVNSTSGITLKGLSPTATLQNPVDASSLHIVTAENSRRIIFEDLVFDGNRTTIDVLNPDSESGLYLSGSTSEVRVTGCEFKKINDTAIYDRTLLESAVFGTPSDTKNCHLIVENCYFHDLKTCLNTIGSSRYGMVQNNHVYNTKFGFKMDGQVSGGTYSTLTGSWIIAGNVFRNIGGADVPVSNGGCVAVEEFVEHVKVTGNIMDTLLNVDGVNIRPGQTSKTVIDLEISHNQIVNVTNGYGVSLSNNAPGTDPTTLRSVRIESNAFNRAERAQVWVLNSNSNTIRELVVRNNEFVDWSVLGTGSTTQNPAVYLELGAGTWEDFTIEGNLFVRYEPTYFNKFALRANMAVGVTSERLLVRNNRFKNRATGDLGVRFDGGAVFFEENYIELGEFYVNGCDLDYMRNRTRGQCLIADLLGATPSTVRAEHNDIRRVSETTAIEMKGGSSITERDNRYDSTYTSQVLLTSGTRKAADLQTYGGGPRWVVGTGTPEGAVTAAIGSLFTRTDGGASTSLYVKESGRGATGWVAK